MSIFSDFAREPARCSADILSALRVLVGDGQTFEIRAPKATMPGRDRPVTEFRRFSARDLPGAALYAAGLTGHAPGCYWTLNALRDDIPAGQAARDADVLRRRLLLIDCDPDRPADTSATESEKAAAWRTAEAIRDYLSGQGWPAPVLADSGNGFHALFAIDLPADDGGLVKRVLDALAARFDDGAVKVDTKVANASRICKLPGTLAAKGESTTERPHRVAKLLSVPDPLQIVTAEQLEAIAADAPLALQPDLAAESERKRAQGERRPRDQRDNRPDAEARALAYLQRCEAAVSGSGGHAQTFKVAVAIGPGFDLDPDVAYRLLAAEYNPRCEPPWSERELQHKVDEAYRVEPRRSWLLEANSDGSVTPPSTNGNGHHGPPTHPGDDRVDASEPARPRIIITTEEHEVTAQAVEALAADPDVFQRGNRLVHVARDVARAKGFIRPAGSPRIVELPQPRLRETLTRRASWAKLRTGPRGTEIAVPAHPPEWAISQVAARGLWPNVRSLEAVVEIPIIRPDGTVLNKPGYDPETGLLFEPNVKFPPVPDTPTREDARWAAEALLAIIADFPMVEIVVEKKGDGGAVHRAAWLSALLTVLVRFAVVGTCPLFLFDANTPGAGKTLLCDLIAWIATGRNMPRTDYPDTNEELRKSVLAVALAGDRLMLFDNVASAFGGPALDSTLTAPTIKGRILGKSEMSGELPMHTVWFATGNNIQLRGDVLRRVVNCRLEPKEERPEERNPEEFAIKEPLCDYVAERRGRLVVQALTIVRAYVQAGRPKQPLTAIDFRAWSDLVRSSIYWATGVDPCLGRRDLAATDADTNERAALVEGWAALPDADRGLTVAEALDLLKSAPSDHRTLRNVLLEWSKSGDLPSARAIGKRLTAIKGRVVNGKALTSRPYQGTHRWSVRSADSGGSGGSGGSGLPLTP